MHPWLARLAAGLALVAGWAGAAGAASLPFVDDSGLVRMELRYGDVVRQLGESPLSRIDVDPGEGRDSGDHVFEYPASGLVFTIRSAERKAVDPRIASMRVTRAEAGATLHGLAVGQPEAEARALLRRHYRVLRDEPGVLAGGHAEGHSRRVVVAEFQRGAVAALSFDTSEPPRPPSRLWQAVKSALGVVLWLGILVIVGTAAWGLRRFFEQRVVGPPSGSSPVLHGLSGLVALGGVVAIVVGLGLLQQGSYAALLGLMVAAGGAGLLFLALLLLMRSRHRGVSAVATGIVLLLVIGSLLAKLFG